MSKQLFLGVHSCAREGTEKLKIMLVHTIQAFFLCQRGKSNYNLGQGVLPVVSDQQKGYL